MIRFDPTTAATSTPVSADAFVPDHSATVLADEAAWRVPPPGNSLGSSVVATRWRGAARLAGEIHHETPQEAHLVMVVMNTANIRLSVNGATIHDGVAMPGMFHVAEPGARVSCLFRGAHEFLHLHVPNALIAGIRPRGPQRSGTAVFKSRPAQGPDGGAPRARPARGRADRRHARRPLRRLHQRGHRDAAVDLGGARRTTGAAQGLGAGALAVEAGDRICRDQSRQSPSSTSDISAAAGLTRMHFAAQFKAATGLRPHEYLLRRRVERAQEMLAQTGMSVVDVALSVGFQSQSHFTVVFNRFVGRPPDSRRRFALYLKTKNFHWHISGPHFRDYHLLLDEQAAQIFAMTDAIAERVRKIGGPRCGRSATSPGGNGSRTMTRIS